MAADHHADRTTLRGLNVQLCWGVCHGEACLERPYRPPNATSPHRANASRPAESAQFHRIPLTPSQRDPYLAGARCGAL